MNLEDIKLYEREREDLLSEQRRGIGQLKATLNQNEQVFMDVNVQLVDQNNKIHKIGSNSNTLKGKVEASTANIKDLIASNSGCQWSKDLIIFGEVVLALIILFL